MPRVRRLNASGIMCFEAFLNSLNTDPQNTPPIDVLTSDETSIPLEFAIDVGPMEFANRLVAAQYLDSKLSDSGLKNIDRDRELWAWFSLYYFDAVCPKDGHGNRKPVKSYHYIPVNTDYRLYYRHLLAAPYRIFRAHRSDPSRALVFLVSPLNVVSHFIYQLASRQELVTNATVVGAATQLYVDLQHNRHKRGAVTQHTPGSVFRFVRVLEQLDRTWDLCHMTVNQLLERLPSEFSRFKGA